MSLHQVDQLGARAHVQHRRVRPRDRRLRARHPRQRERLGFVRPQRLVHDRAVVGLASLQLHRVVAADIDLLLEGHEVAPLAVEHVALALDPLDEQVHHVRHRVRERPGHVVVVAERDPERARQRRAPAEPVAQAERHLVGDAGHRRRQVRVPCNQRALCGRARRRHGPVVRARCLDRHPQEPADRVHSLGQLGAGTGGDPRRQDERIVRRVARDRASPPAPGRPRAPGPREGARAPNWSRARTRGASALPGNRRRSTAGTRAAAAAAPEGAPGRPPPRR